MDLNFFVGDDKTAVGQRVFMNFVCFLLKQTRRRPRV